MYGKNVTPYTPLAPGELIAEGTADADTPAWKIKKAGASFTLTMQPGDLIVNVTDNKSAYVKYVDSDSLATLDEDIGLAGKQFQHIRASQFSLRPGLVVEHAIREIHIPKGDQVYRVGVWIGDGVRQTLLLDTKELYRREGMLDANGNPVGKGFWLQRLQIYTSYYQELIIKNFTLENIEPVIEGVNKTAFINA